MEFEKVLNLTELLLETDSTDSLDMLGDGEDGDIKVIKFDRDLLTIEHSDRIQLQGDVDFDGKVGDVLVFRYEDGVWKEFSRHLVGGQ